nr:hypothetical protein [Tanacetum cinerariifolium]
MYIIWLRFYLPTKSKGFEQIIDFLNANPIKYDLTVNPTIYTLCIKQVWVTANTKNINGEAQIHAKVDGKKVIISEATIRRDLKFEDEGGVDCLSNEVIFEELPLMGVGKNFSGRDTPLFLTMLVPAQEEELGEDEALNKKNIRAQSNDPPLSIVNTFGSGEEELRWKSVKRHEKKRRSRTHGLKRLYKIGLFAIVESSANKQSLGEEDASKQGKNIVGIDADAKITLVDETVEDQGRYDDQEMFDTSVLDDDEDVLLKEAQDVQNVVEKVIEDITTAGIEVTVSTAAPFTTTDVTHDELTIAQVHVEIKKSKTKGETTTKTITIPTPNSTRPKARGVVIFDEQEARRLQAKIDEHDRLAEEKAQLIEDEILAWDNVQPMMDANYELATRLQEEEHGELTIEEKSILFVKLMDKRKKHFSKLREEDHRIKPPSKDQKRDQMYVYLKNMAGFTHNQLKNKSFNEVQKAFDKVECDGLKPSGEEEKKDVKDP